MAQIKYLQKYGLNQIIHAHSGVVIGMSAGSINLARTAICTRTCGHARLEVYDGLGCVDITVEPHFSTDKDLNELLELSHKYEIYGLCDEAIIVITGDRMEYCGDVYRICNGQIEQVSGK